jgi:DNA-directed RNA polymerase specialized sigma24 family protein
MSRWCDSRGRSDDEAEDVVQDVFTIVWDHRANWQPSGDPAAYLFASVRNHALMEVRRRQREERRVQRAQPEFSEYAQSSGGDPAINTFHFEQAIAFKRRLGEQQSKVTGEKLSKATLHATLAHLKRFFQWLSGQPRYKSRLRYSDADYFSLSDKDTRIATARRESRFPTLEQVNHVIARMPTGTEIERSEPLWPSPS